MLAERFADLVGMPPMHYLAKWRMQIASGLLSGGTNIATVAAETGYGSEAAFSRAFKKMVGVPPSAWRRRPARDGAHAMPPAPDRPSRIPRVESCSIERPAPACDCRAASGQRSGASARKALSLRR